MRKYISTLLALAVLTALVTVSLPGQPPRAAQMIAHNLADFQDGKAKYFSYQTQDGVKVRYFVVMDDRGRVHTAADACEVCWRAAKGYTQSGEVMVCNNCGRQFPIRQVGLERGGCNPHPLRNQIKGDKLLISVDDLVEASDYFRF